MSDNREFEDDDLLAAEYALGTLDAVERDAATRRRLSDPDFRARRFSIWEQRLSPVADRVSAEAPSRRHCGDRSSLRVLQRRHQSAASNVVLPCNARFHAGARRQS